MAQLLVGLDGQPPQAFYKPEQELSVYVKVLKVNHIKVLKVKQYSP